MKELRMEELITYIHKGLQESFPKEVVLREEIEGVYQAVINCMWRSARKLHKNQPREKFKSLDISKDFSTVNMKHSLIVDQVENTSGLGSKMSSLALKLFEKRISEGFKDAAAVRVEHIGTFFKIVTGDRQYRIELDERLQVARPRGYGETTRPATKASSSGAASAAR